MGDDTLLAAQVGDPEELAALDTVFCTGRKDPLWIGSIKSSIGHSEPASGLCSVTKCIICMESGKLVPNIHFHNPRKGVKGFEENRMRVVVDPTPWPGGLIGINSFGFGGANCHVLLRSNQKEKVNGGQPKDGLPRVVAVSGRTREAIDTILDDVRTVASRACTAPRRLRQALTVYLSATGRVPPRGRRVRPPAARGPRR